MLKFIKQVRRKVNAIIIHLVITGTVLLFLSVLIVWTDYMLRLTVGLAVVVIAYGFFHSAYKIYSFKKEVEKYFKLK